MKFRGVLGNIIGMAEDNAIPVFQAGIPTDNLHEGIGTIWTIFDGCIKDTKERYWFIRDSDSWNQLELVEEETFSPKFMDLVLVKEYNDDLEWVEVFFLETSIKEETYPHVGLFKDPDNGNWETETYSQIKPIPVKRVITKAEIAEKFGLDIENIVIEGGVGGNSISSKIERLESVCRQASRRLLCSDERVGCT